MSRNRVHPARPPGANPPNYPWHSSRENAFIRDEPLNTDKTATNKQPRLRALNRNLPTKSSASGADHTIAVRPAPKETPENSESIKDILTGPSKRDRNKRRDNKEDTSWKESYHGVRSKENQCKESVDSMQNRDSESPDSDLRSSRALRNLLEYRKVLEVENLPDGSIFDKDKVGQSLVEMLKSNSGADGLSREMTWDALPSPRSQVATKWIFRGKSQAVKALGGTRPVSDLGTSAGWTLTSSRTDLTKGQLEKVEAPAHNPHMFVNDAKSPRASSDNLTVAPAADTHKQGGVYVINKYSSHLLNPPSGRRRGEYGGGGGGRKAHSIAGDRLLLPAVYTRQASIPVIQRAPPPDPSTPGRTPTKVTKVLVIRDQHRQQPLAKYRLTLIKANSKDGVVGDALLAPPLGGEQKQPRQTTTVVKKVVPQITGHAQSKFSIPNVEN